MIQRYLDELKKTLENIDQDKIKKLADKILEVRERGGHVFIIGNGGSAVNASHLACDLTKGTLNRFYDPKHKRLRVVSLTDNLATITALANDLAYDEIFSQQLRNLVGVGDLIIVLTGSGKSKNIINAVELGKRSGAYVFGLLGFDGGEVVNLADDSIIVPSQNYGIIEDVHLSIGHIITSLIKNGEGQIITSAISSRDYLKS